MENFQNRFLLESDAFDFNQIVETIGVGIPKFAQVLFPGKKIDEVLKINRENFNRVFYTFI